MCKKFTLIELLIVVAIIGILLTLLLPSLRKARMKAFNAVCVSNISQIQKGLSNYISGSNGYLPKDPSNRDGDRWASGVNQYLTNTPFSRWTDEQLVEGASETLFGCPLFKPPRLNENLFIRNYVRDMHYAGVFNNRKKWPSKAYYAIVDAPSKSALLTEGNHEVARDKELGNSWLSIGAGVQEGQYQNIIGISWNRFRHEDVMPIGMFDGSVILKPYMGLHKFSLEYGDWISNY